MKPRQPARTAYFTTGCLAALLGAFSAGATAAKGRDVPPAVPAQSARLLTLVRRPGAALAIGHPNRHTLAMLKEALPRLKAQGIRLVPVARIIERQQQRSENLWQASLSH